MLRRVLPVLVVLGTLLVGASVRPASAEGSGGAFLNEDTIVVSVNVPGSSGGSSHIY